MVAMVDVQESEKGKLIRSVGKRMSTAMDHGT